MRKFLIKLDRVSAWFLFIGVVLYFITGYGMTKGIIDSKFSQSLHIDLQVYIIIVAFLIHTPYAIHLALRRWKFWNLFSKILLSIVMIAIVSFIIYAEYIYEIRPTANETNKENEVIQKEVEVEDKEDLKSGILKEETSDINSVEKTFTKVELSQYDGQDGSRAYVAVDGNVYDLSDIFVAGIHFSHFAGKDLTGEFYSRHVKSALADYPVAGKLIE